MLKQELIDGLKAERDKLKRLPKLTRQQKLAINGVLKNFNGTGAQVYSAALDIMDKHQGAESEKKMKAIESLLALYGVDSAKTSSSQKGGTPLKEVIGEIVAEADGPITRSAICEELKTRNLHYTDTNVTSVLSKSGLFVREGDKAHARWRLADVPAENVA